MGMIQDQREVIRLQDNLISALDSLLVRLAHADLSTAKAQELATKGRETVAKVRSVTTPFLY